MAALSLTMTARSSARVLHERYKVILSEIKLMRSEFKEMTARTIALIRAGSSQYRIKTDKSQGSALSASRALHRGYWREQLTFEVVIAHHSVSVSWLIG